MTETTRLTTRTRRSINTAVIKKVLAKIASFIPAAIIFGLFALYYIQLSHMA